MGGGGKGGKDIVWWSRSEICFERIMVKSGKGKNRRIDLVGTDDPTVQELFTRFYHLVFWYKRLHTASKRQHLRTLGMTPAMQSN